MTASNPFSSLYVMSFLFMIGAFAIAGIIVLLVVVLRKNGITRSNTRGNVGEWQVANILKQLNPEQFVILNDIMFEKQQAKSGEIPTTQIDHIVVSIYGIFVMST